MTKLLVSGPATFALLFTGGLAPAWLAAQPAPPTSPIPATRFEYDASGNLTRTIKLIDGGGQGNATQHLYDARNRPHTSIDARGGVVRRNHNGSDQIVIVTDPVQAVTTYSRDGLGQVTGLQSGDSGSTGMVYDAAGLLRSRTDARGMLSTFSHDALGRMTRAEHSGGPSVTQVFNWNYDETFGGTSFGVGQLSSMNGPASYAQFIYDIHGRVVQQLQRSVVASSAFGLGSGPPSVVDHVLGFGYDAVGRLVQLNLPSGRVVRYVRTGGLVQSVSVAATGAAMPQPLISAVRWEPFGAAAAGWVWHLNGGGTSAHDVIRDSTGRVVRYTLGPYHRDVRYDAPDRITGYTHYARATGAAVSSLDQSFAHDELDRLNASSGAGGMINVGYDANGNRSTISIDGASGAYGRVPNSNRMSQAPLPQRSFGHDAAGNRLGPVPSLVASDNFTTVYFDAAGRMSSWRRGHTHLAQYEYDAMGRRVIKIATVSDRTPGAAPPGWPPPLYRTVFVYDGESRLIGEYDGGSGAAIREYVWLDNTPLAMLMPNPADPTGEPLLFHLHADHIDATRMVTDRSGIVRWSWLAEPWGTSTPNENPSGVGAVRFNLRFPGQYFDAESGLHYNFHRYYDPSAGQFTQVDPIGLAGGINTYSYADRDPVGSVDPNGLFTAKWHRQFTIEGAAAAWMSGVEAAKLAEMVVQVDDDPGSQDIASSHMHAMCGTRRNKAECKRRYEAYVRDQLKTCTLKGLAKAVHAVQDSFSGAHEGFQRYGGMVWLAIPFFGVDHWVQDNYPTAFEKHLARMATKGVIDSFKRMCPCPM